MYCERKFAQKIFTNACEQSDEACRGVVYKSYECIADNCKFDLYSSDKYAECLKGCNTNEKVSELLDDHMNCIETFIKNKDENIDYAINNISDFCHIEFIQILNVCKIYDEECQKDFENVGTCFFNCLKNKNMNYFYACNNLCKSNYQRLSQIQKRYEDCYNLGVARNEKYNHKHSNQKILNENENKVSITNGQLLSFAFPIFSLFFILL